LAIERKRFFGLIAMACLIVAVPGCRKPAGGTVDDRAPFASAFRMNDPRAQRQLVSGLYNVENGAWRWTAGKFSLSLQPPPGSETKGAKLALKLNVPDSAIKQLNILTLSAKVGDTSLPPQTFNKGGDYTYEADVPSTALQTAPVRVDFWLDKSVPPSASDRRELGIIVNQVGLIAK
jgi:hypothetical protein